MEFRIKAAISALLITGSMWAQSFEVRHQHLRKGGTGTLTFRPDGVTFDEAKHSRVWKYEEIQRLELSPEKLRIVTYEDVRWQLGRDREYVFDRLPKEMAAQIYPSIAARLDQRLLADLADPSIQALWETPAKMLDGRSGFNGILRVGVDRIVFESASASRTWRFTDIQNISSVPPLELSLTTLDREVRFQLKQVLPEARYNELWRRIQEANGLQSLSTKKGVSHHD